MIPEERALRRSRDPAEWGILADLFEERGEANEIVAWWRRMSELGTVALPVWVEMAYHHVTQKTIELPSGILLPSRRTAKLVIAQFQVMVGRQRYHHTFHLTAKNLLCLPPGGSFKFPEKPLTISQWRYIRSRLINIADFITGRNLRTYTANDLVADLEESNAQREAELMSLERHT